MGKYKFEYIIRESKKFENSSLEYVQQDDIIGYELIRNDDIALFLMGYNEEVGIKELHFAVNDLEPILEILYKEEEKVLITFIKEEWKSKLDSLGFEEYGVIREYWNNNLKERDLNEYQYKVINENEYKKASNITRECRGQSREFNGETVEWIKNWCEGNDENAKDSKAESCNIISHYLDNTMVGIAVVAIYGIDSEKGPILWVRELAVSPRYQGRGFGRALLNKAMKYGQDHGATRAFLMVDEVNNNAIGLYKSVGFVGNYNEAQIDMLYRPNKKQKKVDF